MPAMIDEAFDDFWYAVKVLLIFLGFGLVVLIIWLAASIFRSYDYPPHLMPPRTANLSFSLEPGQTETIPNSQFSILNLTSDYPVSIREGPCYYPRVVDIKLHCLPDEIQITDSRPVLLLWAHANRVTIAAQEY